MDIPDLNFKNSCDSFSSKVSHTLRRRRTMVARNSLFRGWDPWREMGRLQREMNRVFAGDRNWGLSAEAPALNVWRNENGVVLTSEIPGLDTTDLEISITGETVTIRGN